MKILPSADVPIEIDRKIYNLKQHDPNLARFYEGHVEKLKAAETQTGNGPDTSKILDERRALLGRGVRDLQQKVNDLKMKRRHADLALKRVWATFMAAFVCFVVILPLVLEISTDPASPQDRNDTKMVAPTDSGEEK